MVANALDSLTDLYMADEVAWRDTMVELIGDGQLRDLDYGHLKELLEDMSRSDRREVESRLELLLVHLLKWMYQRKKRTQSWRRTIREQGRELSRDFRSSKTLRNHAETILTETYAEAVKWAVEETKLPEDAFPAECPWTLKQLLSAEVLGE